MSTKESVFTKALWDLQLDIHKTARAKGWYDGRQREPLEIHMLICSEIAEASESVRRGEDPLWFTPDGKPEGALAEYADAVIRILDDCAYRGWDLGAAIEKKHAYNKTRPYRHGGKLV
jgi:hypothetical protein